MTKDKHAFTVLHTAASQIVSGDRDVIDPALVRFDPHREYPVTLPDGSIVKGRLRMHEGQIVIDLPLPEETNVFAHFDMAGTRQVWVSLMAEVSHLHAEPRLRKLLQ
jgi:hypothetical protein